jgi:hypothetical protein
MCPQSCRREELPTCRKRLSNIIAGGSARFRLKPASDDNASDSVESPMRSFYRTQPCNACIDRHRL